MMHEIQIRGTWSMGLVETFMAFRSVIDGRCSRSIRSQNMSIIPKGQLLLEPYLQRRRAGLASLVDSSRVDQIVKMPRATPTEHFRNCGFDSTCQVTDSCNEEITALRRQPFFFWRSSTFPALGTGIRALEARASRVFLADR